MQICLQIILFISLINFLECFIPQKYNNCNFLMKALKEREQFIQTIRIDLLKEKLKCDFFSILYFSTIGNKEMINLLQNDLYNLGVPKETIQDIAKLDKFVQDVCKGNIKVKFNKETKKFMF